MELEINIKDLLHKRHMEPERIEFRDPWDPDDIYRGVCAFANDHANIGGGYIVVGAVEKNGTAARPVKGINERDIAPIQKEIVEYGNVMVPSYFHRAIVEKRTGA